MQLGFLTACFPNLTLDEIVPWAAEQGFHTLELASWPRYSRRDYMASHIEADGFSRADADRIRELLDRHGMRISAMAYYDNNLHPDRENRARIHAYLRKVIDAAELLGVERVGTFVGGGPVTDPETFGPDDVLREGAVMLREVVAYAEDRGRTVMVENCPMDNWVTWGQPGNYFYSPELWDFFFNEIPSARFGMNYDPSHLHWLGIDPLRVIRDYGSRIVHAHAKDAELLPEGRYRHGIHWKQHEANAWRSGWWRYRMPGKGELDWAAIVAALREAGYDDVLSIEHEDPEYEGSEAKVKEGLRLGREHLAGLV